MQRICRAHETHIYFISAECPHRLKFLIGHSNNIWEAKNHGRQTANIKTNHLLELTIRFFTCVLILYTERMENPMYSQVSRTSDTDQQWSRDQLCAKQILQ